MNYRFYIFTLLLFFGGAINFSVEAQGTKFTASVSKNTVTVDEQFKLTFKINAQASNFQAPDLSDFRLYSGPNQSSSMQWVNGVMSSSISFSYVLSPRKVGTLTIGEAQVNTGGKAFNSNPITVNAVAANSQSKTQATQPQGTKQNNSNSGIQEQIKDNVFLRVVTNKASPYIGEQIVATYKLFYRVDVIDLQADKLPDFKGFASEEIEIKNNQLPEENVNGNIYRVAVVKQIVLFPQRSGKLQIDALKLKTVLRVRTQSRRRSVFDQFFGGFQDLQYDIESKPISINVKPLPENGKPKNFSGAVGSYSYSTNLDKDSVGENEAINLKVVARGTGNIALLPEPNFKFPVDFEVYDPKVNTNKTVSASGMQGKKSFEYLLIPRHSGRFELISEDFSFFNPKQGKYVVVPGKKMSIQVGEAGNSEGPSAVNFSTRKEAVKFVGKDIRYINTGDANLVEKDDTLFGSKAFYLALGSPFLLLFIVLFMQGRMNERNSNQGLLKRRRAGGIAKKHLQKASQLQKESKQVEFYQELSSALFGYTSDKLGIQRSDLSQQSVTEALRTSGASEPDIIEWRELIEACEMARFAPSSDQDAERLLQRAMKNLENLESSIA